MKNEPVSLQRLKGNGDRLIVANGLINQWTWLRQSVRYEILFFVYYLLPQTD